MYTNINHIKLILHTSSLNNGLGMGLGSIISSEILDKNTLKHLIGTYINTEKLSTKSFAFMFLFKIVLAPNVINSKKKPRQNIVLYE